MTLGQKLAQLRLQLGYENKSEFCRKLGIARPAWYALEADKAKPSWRTMKALIVQMGVNPAFFFEDME